MLYRHLHPTTLIKRAIDLAPDNPGEWLSAVDSVPSAVGIMGERTAEHTPEDIARSLGVPEPLRTSDTEEASRKVKLIHVTFGRNVDHMVVSPCELAPERMRWSIGYPYLIMFYELPGGEKFVFHAGVCKNSPPVEHGFSSRPVWDGARTLHMRGGLMDLALSQVGIRAVEAQADVSYEVLHGGLAKGRSYEVQHGHADVNPYGVFANPKKV